MWETIKLILGPSGLILLGAILVAIGGFWAAIEDKHSQTKIIELNRTIADSITGGDSFCFLDLVAAGGPMKDNPMMVAVPKGKFPVYDVSFLIKDRDKTEATIKSKTNLKDGLKVEDIYKDSIPITIGTCSPGMVKILGRLPLGSGTERKFTVEITARNGLFNENIVCKRINGSWEIASRVSNLTGTNAEVLNERIDPGFPKNKNGQIDW